MIQRASIILSGIILLGLSACQSNTYVNENESANIEMGCFPLLPEFETRLEVIAEHPGPVIGPGYPGTEDNRSGFETGQVVKLDGVYHMFVNEMFEKSHLDLRVSHWSSTDGLNWQRQSTLVESVEGRSPNNHRSEVWCTGVRFNEPENRWNIFFVAYRGGDMDNLEIADADYEGQVWRAQSTVKGKEGIAGPYKDIEIIIKPDENSEWWEGQQGIASFNPYKVGNKWYGFYCSHNHYPPTPWLVGLAEAPALSGPWKRLPEKSPAGMEKLFVENPVVTKLPDGKYMAIYDVGEYSNRPGPYQSADVVAYSVSENGVDWPQGRPLVVQSDTNDWARNIRTPLGLIDEGDGTYSVFYTASMRDRQPRFWAVGKVTVKLANP